MQNKYPQKPGIDFYIEAGFFIGIKHSFSVDVFHCLFGILLTGVMLFGEKYDIFSYNKELQEAFMQGTPGLSEENGANNSY